MKWQESPGSAPGSTDATDAAWHGEPPTIVESLRRHARERPENAAYVFLADGETEAGRLTFAEADLRARAVAAELQSRGAANQRVLICYPACLDYVVAFLGCLYAGAIAVPCDGSARRAGPERLRLIAADARPGLVLGPATAGGVIAGACGPESLRGLDVAEVPDTAAAAWREPPADPDALALLQYTSGSTREPRGVMVSHGNVMANERSIAVTCGHDSASTFVGWLPIFHDMGLIANMLQPAYLGSLSVLMPPTAFLEKPVRWLRAVTRYRAYTSGGPNFAYDLCAARIASDDQAGLDLSGWRVAFNGAEVVRPATLRRFTDAFGPVGFRADTHFPCYGLAEATLIVAGAPRGRPPAMFSADPVALRGGRLTEAAPDGSRSALAACGPAAHGTKIMIVDPETRTQCPAGTLGEVWVTGPSVAQGYWGRPAETAETFGARLAGQAATGPFLRTGDLGGFAAGELVPVGRIKDLIVVRGQNHYPHDLEWTAEGSHPALRPTCGAAFSVDIENEERLVITYETRGGDQPEIEEIAAAVRRAIAERHGIDVHAVALVQRGGVPKTTSGKVRHQACRQAFLTGSLPVLGVSRQRLPAGDDAGEPAVLPSREELAAMEPDGRAAALATVMLRLAARDGEQMPSLRVTDPVSTAGLDSLAATQLQVVLQERYGLELPPLAFLGDLTFLEISSRWAARTGAERERRRPLAPPTHGDLTGPRTGPLSHVQRAMWFEHESAPPHQPVYTLSRAVRLRGRLDHPALERATARVVARHPALRTRFAERRGEPVQVVDADVDVLHVEDVSALGDREFSAYLDDISNQPFALADETLFRARLLRHSAEEHVLVLSAHHAVLDFWSFCVLLRDLLALFAEEADGTPADLRPLRTSPIDQSLAESAALTSDREPPLLGYWSRRLAGMPAALELPSDRAHPRTRGFRGAVHRFQVEREIVAGLRALGASRRSTLFTVLLAAYQVLLSRYTGQQDFAVGTLTSGRDSADLTDVVGCFLNPVPVRATFADPDEPFDVFLERTRHHLLQDLAHGNYPFGRLVAKLRPQRAAGRPPLIQTMLILQRESGEPDEAIRAVALGVEGSLAAAGVTVESVPVPQRWSNLDLTVNLAEMAGGLTGVVEYDSDLFEERTVADLARRFGGLLEAVARDVGVRIGAVGLVGAEERAVVVAAGTGPVLGKQVAAGAVADSVVGPEIGSAAAAEVGSGSAVAGSAEVGSGSAVAGSGSGSGSAVAGSGSGSGSAVAGSGSGSGSAVAGSGSAGAGVGVGVHGLVWGRAGVCPDVVAVVGDGGGEGVSGGGGGGVGGGRGGGGVGGGRGGGGVGGGRGGGGGGVGGGGVVSFGGLVGWAWGLAGVLGGLGVGPEVRVGVLVGRSVVLPGVVLGVWQAGGVYVPLDPGDSVERLAWLVADAGIGVVVCEGGLMDRVPVGVACVDVWGVVAARVVGEAVAVHPGQAAYVMYTSGSSGRPKGVVVSHGGIVNRLLWMADVVGVGSGDRVLHKTPVTFDVSLWELLLPLITGGCVVVAAPGGHRDGGYLAGLVVRERVSVAHFVPSLLGSFLAAVASCSSGVAGVPVHGDVAFASSSGSASSLTVGGLGGFRSGCGWGVLERVVCSGEVLSGGLRDRFFGGGGGRLFNLYGPTEASVDVTWWECGRGDRGAVPIGWPIWNVAVHVLDGMLQVLPVNAVGEVCIGGVAVARGYSGRPGLTAGVFVPDPLGGVGARLYRTGDRGRRRGDGAVEFLGRVDGQVKIAGNRIELAEVEDALRQVPGVTDAAATVDGHGPDAHLTAYIVAADPAHLPAEGDIRAALGRRLPAFMAPQAIVPLASLPLTASGKLDRKALAGIPQRPRRAAGPPARPVTEVERRLAAVWAESLGLADVGIDDDFFAIGGDSIRAIRLVAQARAAGLPVTVADLMRHGTIRKLAGAVAQAARDGRGGVTDAAGTPEAVAEIEPFALTAPDTRASFPAGVQDAYPISMAQRALLFQRMHNPGYEVYVTSLHLRGPFDAEAMRGAVDRLMTRHAYLRSSFDVASHRTPLQLVHERVEPPLTVIDLRRLPPGQRGDTLVAWLHAERGRGFDSACGPLARFCVHRRSAEGFQLTLSSFALDGWCAATVLTEVLTDYCALRLGAPPPTTTPRGGYPDFVALELQAIESPEQRAFWAAELAQAQPCLLPRLPVPPLPAGTRQQRHVLPVDPAVAEALRRLARELSVPLKSVLLAAHLRVVRLLTGRSTVVTGLEVNGRPERADGDRIVGVFNNVVPLRVDLPTGSWNDLIQAAFNAESRILPYRRYPLAQFEREHRAGRLFDTLFVFTHFRVYEQLAALDGLELVDGEAPDQTYLPLTAHFNVGAGTQDIQLLLDYDPRRLSAATAASAGGYVMRSLELAAADPGRPYAADGLLAHDEQRTQLVTWNPPPPRRPGGTLHEAVLRQAARAPDTVAVTDGGTQLSYAAIATRSARLAAALRAAGARPGSVVGLYGPRRVEVIVALLAVLRAGCAYLPLDWKSPAGRVRKALAAAGASLVLGPEGIDIGPEFTALCWDVLGWDVLGWDELGWDVLGLDAGTGPGVDAGIPPDPPVHPACLAYVVSTSGSTGEPKAVGIPHAAVLNYLTWAAAAYVTPDTSDAAVHSSIGVDLTVTSLLTPLTVGGTVHLLPDAAGPEAIGDMLTTGAAPLLKITPAHFEAVGRRLAARSARPHISCVVVGGEQLRRSHLAPWRDLCADAVIVNEYGPSEATVGCVTHRVGVGDADDPVPIGRPIPGTQAYLLDAGQLVPPGVIAELHVGGAGLARGYLGRPGETAEHFVPDPFGPSPGGRLYRTGDLCRREPDGRLCFIGRRDSQLKIRGYRVEPAEIEVELCRHAGIGDALVVPRSGPGGRIRLAAYYVPTAGAAPDPRQIADWLGERLPAHLIPAAFVRLPAFPRTRDGKVDRSRLPDPADSRQIALLTTVEQLSRGEVEDLLARARAAGSAADRQVTRPGRRGM